MNIVIQNIDITSLDVDMVVNAANETLLGGGGVDGAIHQAAGTELAKECWKLRGCNTGNIKVTSGYNLVARFIAHAVGPRYTDGRKNEPALLRSCYERTITFAAENNIRSIAFPAISCGIYRYPVAEAAAIAVGTVYDFLKIDRSINKIIFACSDETYQHYVNALAALVENDQHSEMH